MLRRVPVSVAVHHAVGEPDQHRGAHRDTLGDAEPEPVGDPHRHARADPDQ
jgi:hypothetical protein